jgi:excisionase family DNA binding protein
MVQLAGGDWLTLTEAAKLIGLTLGRLSQIAKADGIPHVRIGRQVMILKADAIAFKKLHRPHGRPKK